MQRMAYNVSFVTQSVCNSRLLCRLYVNEVLLVEKLTLSLPRVPLLRSSAASNRQASVAALVPMPLW